jgi:hypothetical protein
LEVFASGGQIQGRDLLQTVDHSSRLLGRAVESSSQLLGLLRGIGREGPGVEGRAAQGYGALEKSAAQRRQQVVMDARAPGAAANQGYPLGITPEVLDVVPSPAERQALVLEAEVPGQDVVLCAQEACSQARYIRARGDFSRVVASAGLAMGVGVWVWGGGC